MKDVHKRTLSMSISRSNSVPMVATVSIVPARTEGGVAPEKIMYAQVPTKATTDATCLTVINRKSVNMPKNTIPVWSPLMAKR